MARIQTDEPVRVRHLMKTDYEEVSRIYREVIREYLGLLREAGTDELAQERRSIVRTLPGGLLEFYSQAGCSFVALSGERTEGFILAQPIQWMNFDDRVLWLEFIAVRRVFRGRGLGSALLSSTKAWGARRGISCMFTTLNPNNGASKALLSRAGFEVREWLTASLAGHG